MTSETPRPGMTGWTVEMHHYQLPPGLEAHTPITILGDGPWNFEVRDESGRDWTIPRTNIDVGFGYWLDGEYCLETHPKAVNFLRHSLRLIEQNIRIEHGDVFAWRSQLSSTRWYLQRNGHDPDAPLPPGNPPHYTAAPKTTRAPNPRLPKPVRPHSNEPPKRMNS